MKYYWLLAFVAAWIINFGLFGMQRSTLLISRKAGVEWRGGGELLLPSWYPVTWLFIAVKWIILVAIAIYWDWKIAIGLAVGGYILSITAPIPYGAYKNIFYKRVNQIEQQDPVLARRLLNMLQTAPF